MPKTKPTKPTVAIDIDDVLVSTAPLIFDFYNKTYGTSLTLADYYHHENADDWGAKDFEEAIARVHRLISSPNFLRRKPVQQVVAIMQELREHFELTLVTSRPTIMQEATEQWAKDHFQDIFAGVHFAEYFDLKKTEQGPRSIKGMVCKDLGAQALVDDHLEHILSAAAQGIFGVLFGNQPWNQTTEPLPENVMRVSGWQDAKEVLLEQLQ